MTSSRRSLFFFILAAALLAAVLGCRLLSLPAGSAPLPVVSPAVTGEEASDTASPAAGTQSPGTPLPSLPVPTPGGPATTSSPILEPPAAQDPAAALLPGSEDVLPSLANATQYQIAFEIAPDGQGFTGRQQVSVTNTEDIALDSLFFRLLPNGGKSYGNGELSVSEVRAGDAALETTLSGSDSILEIQLPQPLQPGQQVKLDFDFAGKVPEAFGVGTQPSGYGIYNLTDNVLALANAYPILAVYDKDGWNLDPISMIGDSVYSETSFYTVRVCAPSGWVVEATGVGSPEGECTVFNSGPTRDFFLVASPDFEVLEDQVEGTVVRSYYLPGDKAAAQVTLETAIDSVQTFNERLGTYPYTELDLIGAPLRNVLGVEYPGIVLIAASLYDEADRIELSMTTAHEVAHQWWYNVIGNDVFDEPWLDEGLTTYSSTLYYEDLFGAREARGILDYWNSRWETLRESGADQPVAKDLAYFENLNNPGIYGMVAYRKAALFFDALRQEIGDQAFFSALQSYYTEHRFGVATAEDLLSSFETAAGRQLDDFYQTWLYTASKP